MHINRSSHGLLWALACLAACYLGAPPAHASVRLPKVFSSHMVLQREKPLTFWGWADPGESVTVRVAGLSNQTKANERGEWKLTLGELKAGGPFEVEITGSSTLRLEDVMIGEVWLCSGQSNMEMGVRSVNNGQEEIAQANYPGIRLLMVPNRWTPEPQNDVDASWKVCTPENIAEGGWGGFSAAAFFFGRELHKQLGVSIGLIDSDWGGTRIESWTPPEGFAAVPALKREYDLVQLGDPRTSAHERRLGQTLEETEQWVAAARKAMTEHSLVPSMPTY
ncbi:MAG TPA: sialate O-acetylesterase, partial [Verrucomicrobiae bacterium]|nr:sialate O-acetylesterase [Verrucomicrobiae bacterium]